MLKEIEAVEIAGIRREVSKRFFTNIKYKYKVSSESDKTEYPKGVWFETKYIYDENRSWYENRSFGYWSNISRRGTGTWELEAGSNRYYGDFNSDYTEFSYFKKWNSGTSQLESENGKWIFEKPVVDTDGKVSMKAKKSGSSEEVLMHFSPKEL